MAEALPAIAILGASGLIGEAVAHWLSRNGFPVVPIARRFNAAQKAAFGGAVVERPIVELDGPALSKIFVDHRIDIVVNCVGILQDSTHGDTKDVHRTFVERLLNVLGSSREPRLLIQISIPGDSTDDRTPFSLTKRAGERAIAASSLPFVILRPGFVVAPAVYGSSALIRALAMLPFALPPREASRPLAVTDVIDIARSIALVALRWSAGERRWNAIWEVMARDSSTVADVIDRFRRWLGGPRSWMTTPSWLVVLGSSAGDLISHLGWSPPIRSTALMELRRGVTGNPNPWIDATGIEPPSLTELLQCWPANIQQKWFASLYLVKPLVLGSLVLFWLASGLIALTVSFGAATAVLTSHGFRSAPAHAVTIISSSIDILIGLGIATRKSCRAALLTGICVSIFYMVGAAVITPDLWIEPLGALVKTIPATVLMLVALVVLEDR
jgi:uncharacterized protein YbjT (DUF2867 family)